MTAKEWAVVEKYRGVRNFVLLYFSLEEALLRRRQLSRAVRERGDTTCTYVVTRWRRASWL